MPALFDTNGDELRSSFTQEDLSSGATLMGWARVDPGTKDHDWQTPFGFMQAGGTVHFWNIIYQDEDPPDFTMTVKSASGETTSGVAHAYDPGVWYFYAMVSAVTGDVYTLYYRTETEASLSTVTLTQAGAVDMDGVLVAENEFENEWWPGAIAAMKWWDAELTTDEVLRESRFYVPQRLASLRSFWPLLDGAGPYTDYIGGDDFTEGGTVTDEPDGPPIPWTPASQRLLLPSGAAAVQFLRPDSDITVGGWTPTPSSPTTLFDKVDEVTASDTDYISET